MITVKSMKLLVSVTNTTDRNVQDVELLCPDNYITHAGFNMKGSLLLPNGCLIYVPIYGVSYRDLLYQLSINKFFAYKTLATSSHNSLFLKNISIKTKDNAGISITVPFSKDDADVAKSELVEIIEAEYVVDHATTIGVGNISPFETITIGIQAKAE
jgi:hypothetical protein